MLSVAQAVHHPETPGTASKHSVIGHPWSSERSNMHKRRKTESDCNISDKKIAKSSIENLTKQLNTQEITLTVIQKTNNQNNLKELNQSTVKTNSVIEKEDLTVLTNIHDGKKECDRLPSNIPPVVKSFLENSEEIQLTKLGSNDNIKLVTQDIIHSAVMDDLEHSDSDETLKNSSHKNHFMDSNSITELSEVTIEPCSSINKSNLVKSSNSNTAELEIKTTSRTLLKLNKAQELLKKREYKRLLTTSNINKSDNIDLTDIKTEKKEILDNHDKSNFFNPINCIRPTSPLFDEETDHHLPLTSISDYEPFNVGISCDCFYNNIKNKPHYTTGFPNPPGENRCWINATLQALFSLPIMSKLDSLNETKSSKLMTSLRNVHNFWMRGNIGTQSFNQTFYTFKDELSALDKLYSSKAQQDVSEFIMNLLNFMKTELETQSIEVCHNNEIENIPNNEQDSFWKSQTSQFESNKRLPLSEISTTRQHRNNHLAVLNGQSDISNIKISSQLKSKTCNQSDEDINPIDEYFSLNMVENYTCNYCSKQRQQQVENLMLFIDLPTENYENTVNLVDMIHTTYALEQRNMTCESCKHDIHNMITKFNKLPKIIIVQVKRYEMTNDGIITKKCNSVEIAETLKLDSLILNNNQDLKSFPEYEPVCIISHIGDNIDSGHYISFVKHRMQWFYYDDINVKILSAEEVFKCVQNNAYVIFYQDNMLSQDNDALVDEKYVKEIITC